MYWYLSLESLLDYSLSAFSPHMNLPLEAQTGAKAPDNIAMRTTEPYRPINYAKFTTLVGVIIIRAQNDFLKATHSQHNVIGSLSNVQIPFELHQDSACPNPSQG